jgi:hypothetical protein
VLQAFTNAMDDVFLTAIPFVAVAAVASLFIPELPLKTRRDDAELPEGDAVG